MKQFPEEPSELLRDMSVALVGIDGIEKSTWHEMNAQYIPILAALHWQSQLPREMLVKQVIELCDPAVTTSTLA